MTWLAIIVLAIVAFGLAAAVLRMPRAGYALFAATLTFGLAGYALQGSPDYAGAPTAAKPDSSGAGRDIVDARRSMFGPDRTQSYFVTVADGFSRKGQPLEAAQILRKAVADEPDNAEAWLALANALIAHAGGQVTPAALVAFSRSEAAAPNHPAPAYFLGVAWLRAGRPIEARNIWKDLLDNAPPDAMWQGELAFRLARLDAMLEMTEGDRPPVAEQPISAP